MIKEEDQKPTQDEEILKNFEEIEREAIDLKKALLELLDTIKAERIKFKIEKTEESNNAEE
ncbi:MAG: hypothetical protein AAB730_02240 [Patescibacteria group bacterium]